jgi:hypothetical protein
VNTEVQKTRAQKGGKTKRHLPLVKRHSPLVFGGPQNRLIREVYHDEKITTVGHVLSNGTWPLNALIQGRLFYRDIVAAEKSEPELYADTVTNQTGLNGNAVGSNGISRWLETARTTLKRSFISIEASLKESSTSCFGHWVSGQCTNRRCHGLSRTVSLEPKTEKWSAIQRATETTRLAQAARWQHESHRQSNDKQMAAQAADIQECAVLTAN